MAPRKVWFNFQTWQYLPSWQEDSGHEKTSFSSPHFPKEWAILSWEGYIFPTCGLCSSQVNKLKYSLGSDDSQRGKQQFCLQRDRAWSQEIRVMFPAALGKGWAAGFEGPKFPPSPEDGWGWPRLWSGLLSHKEDRAHSWSEQTLRREQFLLRESSEARTQLSAGTHLHLVPKSLLLMPDSVRLHGL